MSKSMKIAAAAAALSAFATMASAVTTINAGDDIIEQGIVTAPNGTVQFDFVAGQDLTIPGFSLAAVGNSGGADIDKIMVSFVPENGKSTLLTSSGKIGDTAWGGGTMLGFSVNEGDSWSILFQVANGQSVKRDVGVELAFLPEAVAPVPLPAAGVLLLAAVAAGGVVGRRKKKVD